MLDVAMLSPRIPFKGIIPPKKNEFILVEIVAKVNLGATENCAFVSIFHAISLFFAIDRLAAIGENMNILIG